MINIKAPITPVQKKGLWPPKNYRAIHQVTDTDNWVTIARKYGITVASLISFNFETNKPEEINWYLRELVGCKLTGPKGYNYSFRGADPAKRKIYIPMIGINENKVPKYKITTVPQISLSPDEIKKYTGISGLSVAKMTREIFTLTNGIKTLLFNTTTIGTSAFAFLSGTLLSTLGTLVMVFLSLGIPVAQAKKIVGERNLKNGFMFGVVIVILGYGKPMLKNFFTKSPISGFGPTYMFGIAQQAMNTGLILGYQSALALTKKERYDYRTLLMSILINEAKKDGYLLYIDRWSDRTMIYKYTTAFSKL